MKVKRGAESPDERLVAHLDVLGFRDLIALHAENGLLSVLSDNISTIFFEISERIKILKYNIKIFSDNICISEMESATSVLKVRLFYLISHLAELQYLNFIQFGILFRGGLTIGNHHMNDVSIVSTALIRGYELESQLANYPRIIVDPSLLDLNAKTRFDGFNPLLDLWADLISIDQDGLPYIAWYKWPYYEYSRNFSNSPVSAIIIKENTLQAINNLKTKSMINLNRIIKDDFKIITLKKKMKWNWLANKIEYEVTNFDSQMEPVFQQYRRYGWIESTTE